MALVSPGVQVSITDESFFSSSGPGTVPLIMLATKQDKLTPDGSGIASGTTAANADKLYLIASQRELLQTFGDPDFNEVGGTAQNGYPLNEFGLLAAYSYLGAANRAYVVRADIDLAELDATSIEPTTNPADGTYWLDADDTLPGLFRYSTSAGAWQAVTDYTVITGSTIADNAAEPSSGYQNDDFIVNYTDTGRVKYMQRINGAWETLGNSAWRAVGTNDYQWAPHAAEPTLQSDGATALDTSSFWLKTTTPSSGLDIVLSHYDSSLGQFATDTVANVETFQQIGTTPVRSANYYYALTEVNATSVTAGTVVAFTDSNAAFAGTSASRPVNPQDDGGITGTPAPSYADLALLIHNGNSTTTITGGTITFPLALAATSAFEVNGTSTGDLGAGAPTNYATLQDLVIALNADAAFTSNSIVVSENAAGDGIVLTNTSGLDIVLSDEVLTTEFGLLGLATTFASNFEALTSTTVNGFGGPSALVTEYVVQNVAPTGVVSDGTYWYDPSFTVDLLINSGTGAWSEVSGTVHVQSSEPASGGANDIWVDTDVTDYPVIYRRNSGDTAWVLVDNTDQTGSTGIIFADARADAEQSAAALDSDAPDPLLYPGGMLLWNTRVSGRNVKVWTENAVTNSYTNAGSTLRVWGTDRWVSASGNDADGSLKTGQDAQKAVVAEKLAAVLVGNEELRDDTIFYNLIATPGFPELIDEMIALNVDRKEQAFVIGDSPFDLSNSTTDLQAWASNSNNAAGNGDDGLVTADTYLGVYYPSGLSTNVDGNEVVVPASHMVLRVMATNDQTAYPWYAPAGFTRGTVTNATSVGYLNSSDEFVPVSLTQGQRDVLQQNNVNPIANIPNRGLVVFGQKTRQATASALDRVNVARLVNYIRYQADQLAQPFLFEPNDTVTRNIVKDAFDSFLAELVTLRGVNDFLVVVDESNNTPARIDNNELWIDIAIQPIKSVEFIFIPIRIRNTGDDLNL